MSGWGRGARGGGGGGGARALTRPPSPPPRSLSNIGSVGGTYMSPVIPPGTVCIGAIGRVARVPRFASSLPGAAVAAGAAGDAVVPAHVLAVSWAADHRVVDGATLARFSGAWKAFVERPETMIAEMR